MRMTDEEKRRRKGASAAAEPEYARVQDACDRFGFSRSGLYKYAGQGKIRLVKLESATLVDCNSAREFMATLPAADIGVGQNGAA